MMHIAEQLPTSAAHETDELIPESFDHEASMAARQFGEVLLDATPADALTIAEARITRWHKMGEDDPRVDSLVTLVESAQAAGVLAGHDDEQKRALVILAATNRLTESEQESFGYGLTYVHGASQEGSDAEALRDIVHAGLDSYNNQVHTSGYSDNYALAVMAFGVGACLSDQTVAAAMQSELDYAIKQRTASE